MTKRITMDNTIQMQLLLGDIAIFNHLDNDELMVVEKYVFPYKFKQDQILFYEGEHAHYMCFVLSGELDIIKGDEKEGQQVVITTIGKGESLGEMSLLDGLPRSATVKARSDVYVIALKREQFSQLQAEHPAIALKIIKAIARVLSTNLRKTSDQITHYMLSIT